MTVRHVCMLLTILLLGACAASGTSAPVPASAPSDVPRGHLGIPSLAAEATPAGAIAAAQATLLQRSALLAGADAAIGRSLRDLDAAGQAMAALEAEGDAVAQAVRLSAVAAGRLAAPDAPLPTPGHALPSQALLALAGPNAGAGAADLAALDGLPEPARTDLARLVDRFADVEAASVRAFGPAGTGGVAPVLSARQGFLEAVASFQQSAILLAPLVCITTPVNPVFSIELGDCGPTAYCGIDIMLIVDMSGNDLYCNNAGGNGAPGCAPPVFPAAALVDVWGNDRYLPAFGRGCGVNGGGFGGSGILVDVFGDDTYKAGSRGTNGGADGSGTGLLVDAFGNDAYTAGSQGTNGGAHSFLAPVPAGIAAIGVLVDVTGSDVYDALDHGTNGGSSGGSIGALIDAVGDDAYTATFDGVNGGGHLRGIGFLVDGLGNDAFSASSNGVNGGAFAGNGLLVDGTESDTYSANGGAANGGGSNGIGILVDILGNDQYTASGPGTNGGAEAGVGGIALGLLVDLDGDDVYTDATGSGTNGGASSPLGGQAVGALIDFGFGVDTYTGAPVGFVGQNGAGDGGSGIGLLADVGGFGDVYCDTYNAGCAADASIPPLPFLPPFKTTNPSGLFGAQLDL